MYQLDNDCNFEIHKGRLLSRSGYEPRSRVMMYSDEEKPFFVSEGGVETLASVPQDCCLPDSFTQDNPKYTHFKKAYWGTNYAQKGRWDSEFQRTRIYILDPTLPLQDIKLSEEYERILVDGSEIGRKQFISEELAWRTLLLDPHSWMHYLELKSQGVTYALPDIDEFVQSRRRRYREVGGKFLNARRLVLRSQALNHELLDRSPVHFSETGQIKFRSSSASLNRVTSSLDVSHTYDSGDSKSLDILRQGQTEKLRLLKSVSPYAKSLDIKSSSIEECFSADSEQTQFAGIAAGHADNLYKDSRLKEELPQRFESVWINGQSMTRS